MKKFLVLIEMASENGLWRGFAPDFEKLEAEAATPEELLSKLREALGERLERLREAGEAEPEPMPLECVPMPESFHDWRLARVEPEGDAELVYPCDLLRVLGNGAYILTCNTPSLSFMGEDLEDVKRAMSAGIREVLEMRMNEGKSLSTFLPFPEAIGMRSADVVLIPVAVP